MNNSPLLILDYDTSELIGFYLEIIKKYKRDIVQKYKRVVQEFHKNINILQYHFNITVNNQNLINFNKEIYYNENELTMKELLCYRKTGYVWNGMRHSEIIPMTIPLTPFKRSYNKSLNKQISKLIKNFEEKMRDNTTYTTHNAYNFLIDDYYNPNMDIYIEE